MKTNLLAAACAAAALAGCQTASAPSAPPRNDASAIFTTSGVPVRAKHYRDVSPDCANLGYANIAIITPPRGGAIELKREGAIPSFAANNPRAKCNSRPVEGVGVYYKPNPGFAGPDRFTIDIYWADGARWTEDFTVQVR